MITNPTDQQTAIEGLRSEQTLRRMWAESISLATRYRNLWAEADKAAEDALAAETVAAAHRKTEQAARDVAEAALAEAQDLVDIVNEKRAEAGLSPLAAGEPYDPPAETASQPPMDQAPAAGQPVAGLDPYRAPAATVTTPGQDGGAER